MGIPREQYFYCHQHGVTSKFSRATMKIACEEGGEILAANFPLGERGWFYCRACDYLWEEKKEHYLQCPASRCQATKLYQCPDCNTFILEAMRKKALPAALTGKATQCPGCLKTWAVQTVRIAHECQVVRGTIFTTRAECRFCGEELQELPASSEIASPVIESPLPKPIPKKTQKEPAKKNDPLLPPKAPEPEIKSAPSPPPPPPSPRQLRWVMVAGGSAALVLLIMGVIWRRPSEPPKDAVQIAQATPETSVSATTSPKPRSLENSPTPTPDPAKVAEEVKAIPAPTVQEEATRGEKSKGVPTQPYAKEKPNSAESAISTPSPIPVRPSAPAVSPPTPTPMPTRLPTPAPTATPMPTRSPPPTTPAPVPKAAYSGPTSGTIRLNQTIEENEMVDVGGQLPGVPVVIESVEPQCCIGLAGRPSPSNGWKKLIVRSTKKMSAGVTIRWRVM